MIAHFLHLSNVQEPQTQQDDNVPLTQNEHKLRGGVGDTQPAPPFCGDVILSGLGQTHYPFTADRLP